MKIAPATKTKEVNIPLSAFDIKNCSLFFFYPNTAGLSLFFVFYHSCPKAAFPFCQCQQQALWNTCSFVCRLIQKRGAFIKSTSLGIRSSIKTNKRKAILLTVTFQNIQHKADESTRVNCIAELPHRNTSSTYLKNKTSSAAGLPT